MIDNSTMLIGFPETGKSTYLAALYHYVNSTTPDKSLSQFRLSPDTEYLNKILNKWLSFEIPGRTIQEGRSNRNVVLYLKDASSENEFVLNIPDIEGEVFKNQWELRGWSKDYISLIKVATGLLFFINIDKLVNHYLISDMAPVLETFLSENSDLITSSDEFESLKDKWAHDKAPTQVRLVEILQFHIDIMFKKSPIPIAFILSAWDKQIDSDPNLTAVEWVKINLPLLYQFLESNEDLISYEVIGISAQGSDYKNEQATNELKRIDEPAQRVKVAIKDHQISHDIAYPINWIISKWKETQDI